MKGLTLLNAGDLKWLKRCVQSKLMGLDYDEAWQECQIAIWKCGESYDPSVSSLPFRWFVWVTTKRRMNRIRPMLKVMHMSEYSRKKGDSVPPVYSLDLDVPAQDGKTYHEIIPDTTLPDPSEKLDKANSFGYLCHTLTEQEKDLIAKRLEGTSLQEIGEGMGLTRQRIQQLEVLALQKIQHARNNWEKIRPRQVTAKPTIRSMDLAWAS